MENTVPLDTWKMEISEMRTDFGRMDRVPSEPSLQEEQGQHISTPFSVPPIGEHDFEGPSYKKNQQQQKTNKQTNKMAAKSLPSEYDDAGTTSREFSHKCADLSLP